MYVHVTLLIFKGKVSVTSCLLRTRLSQLIINIALHIRLKNTHLIKVYTHLCKLQKGYLPVKFRGFLPDRELWLLPICTTAHAPNRDDMLPTSTSRLYVCIGEHCIQWKRSFLIHKGERFGVWGLKEFLGSH